MYELSHTIKTIKGVKVTKLNCYHKHNYIVEGTSKVYTHQQEKSSSYLRETKFNAHERLTGYV